MTRQEIFDKVAKHLFHQGRRAVFADGGCAYRGINNTSCAVGCLITNELYHAAMETHSIEHIAIKYKLTDLLEHIEILAHLQKVHDTSFHWRTDENMKNALREVAVGFKLNSDILNTLTFHKE